MAFRPPAGPPLWISALSFAGLTIAGIVFSASVPRPTASAAEYFDFVRDHPRQLRLGALFFLAAAMPLAVWTATVHRRVRGLGGNPPGAGIALVGGTLAAVALALTGLVSWVASRAANDGVAASLRDLVFITGGPGFMAAMGLLYLGVSIPMVLIGIARPAAIAGLVLGAVAELSILTLLTLDVAPLLPMARFGGIAWMIAVSVLLPADRKRRASAEVRS